MLIPVGYTYEEKNRPPLTLLEDLANPAEGCSLQTLLPPPDPRYRCQVICPQHRESVTPEQPHSQSLRSWMSSPVLLPELCLSLAAFRKEKPLQASHRSSLSVLPRGLLSIRTPDCRLLLTCSFLCIHPYTTLSKKITSAASDQGGPDARASSSYSWTLPFLPLVLHLS